MNVGRSWRRISAGPARARHEGRQAGGGVPQSGETRGAARAAARPLWRQSPRTRCGGFDDDQSSAGEHCARGAHRHAGLRRREGVGHRGDARKAGLDPSVR
jgi:hypothetical protein